MKDISISDIRASFKKTRGALSKLKTKISRRRHEWEDDLHAIGDPFVRDLSVILQSKAWRRMGGKNQVSSSSNAPYIRNRATHVHEVMAISVRLAEHLGLNTHLTMAIAAGHDIGHFPFGHQGEHYLKVRLNLGTRSITHEVMGVVIAQHLERRCNGLNLTHATLDGMFRHSGNNSSQDMTQEAWVVKYADKIAYLFADYNDFQRMRWHCSEELDDLMSWFGASQRDRVMRTSMALCEESAAARFVIFEKSEAGIKFVKLRQLMYKEYGRVAEQDVGRFLDPIYDFLQKASVIKPWLGIALLTDHEVCRLTSEPHVLDWRRITETGLGEILENTPLDKLNAIDGTHLDLDW